MTVSIVVTSRLPGRAEEILSERFDVRVHDGPSLVGRSDVVLLPHVGSAMLETRAAMAELAADNVVAVLEGREPPTPVVRGRPPNHPVSSNQ